MNTKDEVDKLRQRIAELEAECINLRDENSQLRRIPSEVMPTPVIELGSQNTNSSNIDASPVITQSSTSQDKIKLFRSLFQGRQDVYPIRWVNKKGRSGY